MLVMFKVVVAATTVPGPLLGDGTNTTVTPLYPSAMTQGNSLGARSSIFNQTTRQNYTVSKLQVFALHGNGGNAYVGARGSALANMIELTPGAGTPQFGSGLVSDIDMGDFDVDASVNGEGFLVVAEMQ